MLRKQINKNCNHQHDGESNFRFHSGYQSNQAVGQGEDDEDELGGQADRNASCERRAK
ncbi:hypothetical protein D9M69_728780 [compost metagenome]